MLRIDDDEIVPDSQEGSDLEQKYLTMTAIDTTSIYNKVMEAKKTASNNPASSVTEPDDDIPICLWGIPEVCDKLVSFLTMTSSRRSGPLVTTLRMRSCSRR
jgi:hypothetical protein